jgi:ligand-binding sensor domain-containing protein/two-component sensor histidine kinase
MKRCAALALLFAVLHAPASAQSASPLRFTNISTPQGLSSGSVSCLAQDHRGFVWIGTRDGLNVYDGTAFRVYRHSRFDSASICNNDVRSVVEDTGGTLWIGTQLGVSRMDPLSGRCKTYLQGEKKKGTYQGGFICRLLLDAGRQLWVFSDEGIGRYDRASDQFLPFFEARDLGRQGALLHTFYIDRQNRKWAGTDAGLCLLNEAGRIVKEYCPEGGALINSITQDRMGYLWCGCWGKGLYRFDPAAGKFEQFLYEPHPQNPSATNIVFSVFITDDTLLWIGSNHGLYRMRLCGRDFNGTVSTAVNYMNVPGDAYSLSGSTINCFLRENNGDLWMGGESGLSILFRKNSLFRPVPGVKGDIMELLFTSDRVYSASWYGEGLVEYDRALRAVKKMAHVPGGSTDRDNGQVSDVLVAKDGTRWVATFHGLVHLMDGRAVTYIHDDGDSSSIASMHINALAEDGEGNIWIGTYGEGIDEWLVKENRFVHHSAKRQPALLCQDLIWELKKGTNGDIYCGTNAGLVTWHAAENRFECLSQIREKNRTIPVGIVSGIYETRSGELWFGGIGLYRKDKQGGLHYYSTEDGLCSHEVNGIAEDEKGNIWIATVNGLSCYMPGEDRFINYDEQDGLPGNYIHGLFPGENGTLYLNIDRSLYAFSPASIYSGLSPNAICITAVDLPGEHFNGPGEAGLALRYNQNDLGVHFVSPFFSAPGKINYRYMLAGADNDWKLSGGAHTATYDNLPPGHYTFSVQASDMQGAWTGRPATFSFTIAPPFWATWWFRTLEALAVGGLIYLPVHMRQRRKAQVELVRTRIARDLHDDIGSTLSSINILSEMAKQKAGSDAQKVSQLVATIGENSQSMLEKMDDIVWSIKPGNDQLVNIVSRMREYASQTLEARNIAYQFRVSDEVNVVSLPLGQRYDFFLVFKEAVNNLAKYSGSAQATVELYRQNGSLLLVVEDAGKGFDPDREQDGNGLRNMKKRAAVLKAKLDIRSEPGKGTRITLAVPLK